MQKYTLFILVIAVTISASAAKQLDRSPVYPSVWHRPDTAIIYPNLCDSDMFLPILMRENGAADTRVAGTYHYHTDHLGSAHWITKGYEAVQFIHYMPYGEMWYNQQGSAYNERFKYTGKERDSETGYDYFGARSYMSDGPLWLSQDPLMDKYPHISPYAYCNWNPVKYVDPDGKWIETAWDISNVVMDIQSLYSNVQEKNITDAVVDGASLLLDAVATIIPAVPAGGGTAIKAARTANFLDNTKRGVQSEQRVLNDMRLLKNTKKIESITDKKEVINVIPDAIQEGVMYEIKDTKVIYNTRQIQGERNAAKEMGQKYKIVTGKNTHVSHKISQDEIIRRNDLGQ